MQMDVLIKELEAAVAKARIQRRSTWPRNLSLARNVAQPSIHILRFLVIELSRAQSQLSFWISYLLTLAFSVWKLRHETTYGYGCRVHSRCRLFARRLRDARRRASSSATSPNPPALRPLAGIMGMALRSVISMATATSTSTSAGSAIGPTPNTNPPRGRCATISFATSATANSRSSISPSSATLANQRGVFADLRNSGNLDLYAANNTKGKSARRRPQNRTTAIRAALSHDKGSS